MRETIMNIIKRQGEIIKIIVCLSLFYLVYFGCTRQIIFTETLDVILGISSLQINEEIDLSQRNNTLTLTDRDLINIGSAMVNELKQKAAFSQIVYPAELSEEFVLYLRFDSVFESTSSNIPSGSDASQDSELGSVSQNRGSNSQSLEYSIKTLYQLNKGESILGRGIFYIKANNNIASNNPRTRMELINKLTSDAKDQFLTLVHDNIYPLIQSNESAQGN
jgi:hypothetical protein